MVLKLQTAFKGSNDFIDYINKLECLMTDMENGTVLKKMSKIAYDIAQKDLTHIYNLIVDNFYASYNQKYYTRKYSLKKAFLVETGDNYIELQYGYGLLPNVHRLGPEALYELTFEEGYHGGAKSSSKLPLHPAPGQPYGRMPVPLHARNQKYSNIPMYSLWSKHPQPKTTPPMQKLQKALKSYDTKFDKICADAYNNVVQSYGVFA